MRQEQFIARHAAEWQAFEHWLDTRGQSARLARRAGKVVATGALRDEDMPLAYRRLCQQLALARRRGYGPGLQARLQALMQRGHDVLYRTPPTRLNAVVRFLGATFPRLVRAEWRCMLASLLLFGVPLAGCFLLVLLRPEWIHSVFGPAQVAAFEQMYDPADPQRALGRSSGTDLAMFGHYLWNNTSIGLRTFASGLLVGIGPALTLAFNGLMIGSIGGYLQAIGHGDPFWRFVAGHSALELSAIVVAGGAGLQLGLRVLAPGRRSRRDALVDAGRRGGLLATGAAAMFFAAAFVEAYWSSIGAIPAAIKYGVGGAFWLVVLGWLLLGGRGGADAA